MNTVALLLVLALVPEKPHYVPLTCIARFVVLDWGKCTKDGQVWTCPNTKTTFVEGCISGKSDGLPATQNMNITRPTAILKEEK